MQTYIFPGEYESLEKIAAVVREAAQNIGLDDCEIYKIETSVDEACSNIIEHAYGGENKGNIELTCESQPDKLTIVLKDYGRPFNPDKVPKPDLSKPLSKRQDHGLGLFIMSKWMDKIMFETLDGVNTITLVKLKE